MHVFECRVEVIQQQLEDRVEIPCSFQEVYRSIGDGVFAAELETLSQRQGLVLRKEVQHRAWNDGTQELDVAHNVAVEEGLVLLGRAPVDAPALDEQRLQILELYLRVSSDQSQDHVVVGHTRELLANHCCAALRIHGHEPRQAMERGLNQRCTPRTVHLRQLANEVFENTLTQFVVTHAAVQGAIIFIMLLVEPGRRLVHAAFHGFCDKGVPLYRALNREELYEQPLRLFMRVMQQLLRRRMVSEQMLNNAFTLILRQCKTRCFRHSPGNEPQELAVCVRRQGVLVRFCLCP